MPKNKKQKRKNYKIEKFLFRNYMEKGEEIKYVIHLHPLIYHTNIAKLKMFYFVIPIVLLLLFPFMLPISLGLMFVGLIKLMLMVFDWYYHSWLVTNKGVISIEAKDIWHRYASRTEHEMIAGISFEKKGLMAALLNYGTITLEKAGNSKKIIKIAKIKNPLLAELKIVEQQKAYMKEKSDNDHQKFKEVFHEMTHAYLKSRA